MKKVKTQTVEQSGIIAVEKASECKLAELQKIFSSLNQEQNSYNEVFKLYQELALTNREILDQQSEMITFLQCRLCPHTDDKD